MFGLAFAASLFFNGMRIEYFALSLFILLILLFVVLWKGYSQGLSIPKTPLAITLTLFWVWLAVTQVWSTVPYVTMVNFWWVGSAVLVFWLVSLSTERSSFFPGAYIVVLAVGIVLALLSFYQQLRLGVQAQSTFLTRNSHAGMMCLLAVPVSSHFLIAQGADRNAIWITRLLGLVLFILFFSLALTSSRGATLGLFIALAVVLVLAYGRIPRARILLFLGIVALAYIAANFLAQGEVSARLSTLVKLEKADPGRLLIWQTSWQMLKDSPWWGTGIGTYWLHWPPYRDPRDGSAGFYVHNDYLQIWIETGLPGLLLLLAVYVAALAAFVRLWRHQKLNTAVLLESAGLFGGLLAVAVHTFFDFDLYIHPIQLALGLILARLHSLYVSQAPSKSFILMPAQRLGSPGYRTIILLFILLPLMYFAALGVSAMLTYKARDLVVHGKWVEASTSLTHAGRLMPTSDIVLTAHADLLRQAALKLPAGSAAERKLLYQSALAMLEDAEKVNPLRPQIFFMRGLLYQQYPDLAGEDWNRRATQAYATALKRDPMAFWAREAYGRLLLGQGKLQEAKALLEGGMEYQYAGTSIIGYYALVARVRREAGEESRAIEIEKRIDAIVRAARSASQS